MYQGSNFIIKASCIAICKNIRLAWQIVRRDSISTLLARLHLVTWYVVFWHWFMVHCRLLLLVKESIQASKKPKLVVLYVGTNDLQYKEPKELADGMKLLRQGIVTKNPTTEIAISEIVRRQDSAVNNKTHETNILLSSLCEEANWYFIRHDNIDNKHLNGSGLHLNRQGTAILAKNYIDVFKNSLVYDNRNQLRDNKNSETEFTTNSNTKNHNITSTEHSPYINIEPKANVHHSISNVRV